MGRLMGEEGYGGDERRVIVETKQDIWDQKWFRLCCPGVKLRVCVNLADPLI